MGFFHLFLISYYVCCYHLFLNFDVILVLRLSRPQICLFSLLPFFSFSIASLPCSSFNRSWNLLNSLPRMVSWWSLQGCPALSIKILTTQQKPLSRHPRLLCPSPIFYFLVSCFPAHSILFVYLCIDWQLGSTRHSCAGCVLLKVAGCRKLKKYSFIYRTTSPSEWLVRLKEVHLFLIGLCKLHAGRGSLSSTCTSYSSSPFTKSHSARRGTQCLEQSLVGTRCIVSSAEVTHDSASMYSSR